MRTPRTLDRRRFLRGTGGVAVGLPFLLARPGDTRAAPTPPERLVTVFFGNGLPKEMSERGFDSPALAPLRPHAPKLTMVRGVNVHAESPGNGHVKGSAGFACAMDTATYDTKGGPSLDWVVYKATGAATPLATLSTGVYGADDASQRMRIVHSWRGPKQPNEPIQDTLALFHHVFGGRQMLGTGPQDPARQARYRVSVLDAVLAEYKQVTSEASGYPAAVRSLVSDHLETVREVEKRAIELARAAAAPAGSACKTPTPPPALDVLKDKRPEHWDKAWPIMVELYVLALRCDLVRFGNMMVISGGDRFPFTCPAGSLANIHADGYHRWPGQNAAITLEAVKWKMAKIAHFLARLDDPAWREANGGTLLDNTTLVIGTELGDPAPHLRDDMTFLVGGARGRFRRGVFTMPRGTSDVDLYNTVLRGLGLDLKFGDQRYFKGQLPIVA